MTDQKPEPTFSEHVERINQAGRDIGLAFANSKPVLETLKAITRLTEALAESQKLTRWKNHDTD
jgi:hypothetical protein